MIRMLLFHIHAPFLVISLQLWDISVCCFLPFLMLKELYFRIIYFNLELCLDSCVNLLLPFPCLYLLNESLSMGSKSVIKESLYDMAPATLLPPFSQHSPHTLYHTWSVHNSWHSLCFLSLHFYANVAASSWNITTAHLPFFHQTTTLPVVENQLKYLPFQ